jgi:hypothetical protein
VVEKEEAEEFLFGYDSLQDRMLHVFFGHFPQLTAHYCHHHWRLRLRLDLKMLPS